jgi:hypothetical protein
MPRAYARWLFGLAAAFNLAVGLALAFGRDALGPMLELDPVQGGNLVLGTLTGLLVAILGVLYAMIARDPVRLRPVIGLAVAGKLLAFVCVALPWFFGEISASLPTLASGDLILAALFAHYLWATRKE